MTLRMIAGIVAPDRGRIVLNDRVLFDSATGENMPAAQRKIGSGLSGLRSVSADDGGENIGFGLERGLPKRERQARVFRSLNGCTLPSWPIVIRLRSQAGSGSAWRSRGAWPLSRMRCCSMNLLRRLIRICAGKLRSSFARRWPSYNGAVIFVTHDMEEAFRFCTRSSGAGQRQGDCQRAEASALRASTELLWRRS